MQLAVAILTCAVLLTISSVAPSDLGAFRGQNDPLNTDSLCALPVDTVQHVPWVLANLHFTYPNAEGEPVIRFEQAKYGEGKILNVEGKLVHVTSAKNKSDHTGCDQHILGTNGELVPSGPWVALIYRGRCNFEDKVRHAWLVNATGVIVYNDRDSINLDKMKIIGKDRDITAIFTYKWVGEQFARLVDNGVNVSVSINELKNSQQLC